MLAQHRPEASSNKAVQPIKGPSMGVLEIAKPPTQHRVQVDNHLLQTLPTGADCLGADQESIMNKLFSALALVVVSVPAWAATQTVTLSVPGMTCAACPFTVKKALSGVEGVSQIDVSFEKREAVVTFDDSKTRIQTLTQTTENAGYPSSLKR